MTFELGQPSINGQRISQPITAAIPSAERIVIVASVHRAAHSASSLEQHLVLHLHHVAWPHLSTYPLYAVFNLHRAGVLEDERPFDVLTLA